MRRFFLLASVALLVPTFFSSCVDESLDFSQDEIDTHINVGGENLTVPVGHVRRITMADLVEKANVEELSVREDNLCALAFSGQRYFEMDPIPSFKIQDVEYYFSKSIEVPSLMAASAVPATVYSVPIRQEMDLKLHMEDIPSPVLAINRVAFDDLYAEIHIGFEGVESFYDNDLRFKGELVFPDEIILGDGYPDHRVSIDESLTEAGIDIMLPLQEVYLDNMAVNGAFDYSDLIIIDGNLSGDLSYSDLSDLPSEIIYHYRMLVRQIDPAFVEGRVDLRVERQEKIYIEGVPENMDSGDLVLDIMNPYVILGLNHEFGFDVDFDLDMISHRKEKPLNTISTNFSLEGVESKTDIVYLLAESEDMVVEPFDVFVKTKMNKLLNPVPDMVQLDVTARTVPDRNMIVYFDKKYPVILNYDIVSPIVLGPDFSVDMDQNFDLSVNTDLDFVDMQIVLLADIESTLPLDVTLSAQALDAQGKPLNLEIGEFNIASCEADGSPVRNQFEIPLKGKLSEISRMKSLKLMVKANAGKAVGVPLMGDDYLEGDLALRLPGGVTVDLSQIQ